MIRFETHWKSIAGSTWLFSVSFLFVAAGCYPIEEPGGVVNVPLEDSPAGSLSAWAEERALDNLGASADGVVGCNIVTASTGRVTIFNRIFGTPGLEQDGLYQTSSEDGGLSWSAMTPFAPAHKDGMGLNVAIDSSDRIHAIWREMQPVMGIFYARSEDQGVSWSEAVLISHPARYQNNGGILTVDFKQRVHVMYFDGDANSEAMPCEAYYTRSVDAGLTWESPRMLSRDDGKHSAWPRADFSGVEGDDLCIVWREQVLGDDWDIRGAISNDGGSTWVEALVAGGNGDTDTQWDPMAAVDKAGRFHVSYMNSSAGDPFEIAIHNIRSVDGGATWSEPQVLSEARSRFSFYAYDRVRDILWCSFKDESEFDLSDGNSHSKIVTRYSTDHGETWSSLEVVTNEVDRSYEIRFPAFSMGADGKLRVTYSHTPEGVDPPYTVYYRERRSVPATGFSAPKAAGVHDEVVPLGGSMRR
ncbi:MAG: sialidase family protein [Planctomycetota bacterium]|jgi:hypothetical protein|nr:sialidase family protein [Planctomycetota bacterium]